VDGSAKIIITNFDEQSHHRRAMEAKVISDKGNAMKRGQWMAFGLSLIVICAGAWLIWTGKTHEGISTITRAAAALALVFIAGRAFEFAERRGKAPPG
jgi:uncharacterized membrane protein